MKNVPAFLFLLGLLSTGCQRRAEPQPAVIVDFDLLRQARGHWEWEHSFGFRWQKTPVTEGLTRQLIFKADSQVYIYHNRQLQLQTPYRTVFGISGCRPPAEEVPQLRLGYASEPRFPNNEVRNYSLRVTGTDTMLFISGIQTCSDGGATERYRWRRH